MSIYSKEYLKAAHKHSIFHQTEILASEKCSCFYCQSVFIPSEITEWVDVDDPRGKTALCPKCDIDAVLRALSGYPVGDKEFINEMNKCFF
ncbi:hypothetical protein [Mucilaginibacter sp.]|uniref:hypothetical protein n=1 Tax=Mucilaginibacter sp. TaxID=1882438 RepID=UPI0035BC5BC7